MPDLVTAQLSCRLGNNLFQLAAAYAYALRHGKKFYPIEHPQRMWSPYQSLGITPQPDNAEWNEWKEPTLEYYEIPPVEGNVKLKGYFQSEKYFQDYLPEIHRLFTGFSRRIQRPVYTNSCAIHIRRTDYLTNDCMVNLPDRYYQEALDMIRPSHITFFSDDIHWLENKINDTWTGGRKWSISYSQYPFTAMLNMAWHDFIIGANSTFSLWAAILSGHDQAIFPLDWFTGPMKGQITRDMVPVRFTRI